VNTDALGWVIRRVTGKSIGQNLSEMIWSQLGMEQDAYFTVDSVGNEFAGGGLNTGLRDLARFGEMIRNNGRANGKQILPEAAILDIRRGGRATVHIQSRPMAPMIRSRFRHFMRWRRR
jgi:CubicO group peptidase (beta-lactamase class C family)